MLIKQRLLRRGRPRRAEQGRTAPEPVWPCARVRHLARAFLIWVQKAEGGEPVGVCMPCEGPGPVLPSL